MEWWNNRDIKEVKQVMDSTMAPGVSLFPVYLERMPVRRERGTLRGLE